ncbi:ketopantoate hydroxymethyltransferase [Paenibacillus sp. 481]|uniref:ketopantoate hydroxymethyltransferase n=1 Tax=Paenibacillus sp. 481 TaxID=2835869 RepID=UPI001E4DC1E9|nr:ketopantoate hydroxymethyltransferase [Paenibacillus sp. 481]UHA72304.1 ketopantoate hydroxymethyltransferase [Paenibacillus sp. 481]
MITASVMHELSAHIHGKIAKVVLNGKFEITQFRVKQVTNALVELEYLIPANAVDSVTLIELRDAQNGVISTNHVFVPVPSDTLITQQISVKEVG